MDSEAFQSQKGIVRISAQQVNKALLSDAFSVSVVDHALHHDARAHPGRGGGLRCGCLLWTQRGCFPAVAMVRNETFLPACAVDLHCCALVNQISVSSYLESQKALSNYPVHATVMKVMSS